MRGRVPQCSHRSRHAPCVALVNSYRSCSTTPDWVHRLSPHPVLVDLSSGLRRRGHSFWCIAWRRPCLGVRNSRSAPVLIRKGARLGGTGSVRGIDGARRRPDDGGRSHSGHKCAVTKSCLECNNRMTARQRLRISSAAAVAGGSEKAEPEMVRNPNPQMLDTRCETNPRQSTRRPVIALSQTARNRVTFVCSQMSWGSQPQ